MNEKSTFSYDENGNLVQKTENNEVTSFVYSVDNRLELVEDEKTIFLKSIIPSRKMTKKYFEGGK